MDRLKLLALAPLCVLTLAVGCGTESPDPGDQGTGGAGDAQTGGAGGGSATGGKSGGTGGAGSGGAGTGGAATGGAGGKGTGGAGSGTGGAGTGGAGTGGAPGTGGAGPGTGGAGGGAPDKALDACFAKVRAGVGTSQIANKASADGKIRMRIALETADRFGTSGGVPYLPLGLAIETPDAHLCITDEGTLAAGYMHTHHNCSDKLVVTSGGLRYEIAAPDTSPAHPDSTLSVFMGDKLVLGPTKLTTSTCVGSSPTKQCRSGGGGCP